MTRLSVEEAHSFLNGHQHGDGVVDRLRSNPATTMVELLQALDRRGGLGASSVDHESLPSSRFDVLLVVSRAILD